eukprot:TRINITY_DN20593_c0_g1::TRINITY_DN20593_c0_g1_i1::g.12298::m.12298 TRINITY_DN20593_c0_g1::TRINITY_DN20593_c0_g1_i1::g.12298  ORF type:complete len:114 (-),score=4.10,Fusion_gly/PF00523.13/0.12 TRINITY_DN20593_c0_g1_i1:162-503(-)
MALGKEQEVWADIPNGLGELDQHGVGVAIITCISAPVPVLSALQHNLAIEALLESIREATISIHAVQFSRVGSHDEREALTVLEHGRRERVLLCNLLQVCHQGVPGVQAAVVG